MSDTPSPVGPSWRPEPTRIPRRWLRAGGPRPLPTAAAMVMVLFVAGSGVAAAVDRYVVEGGAAIDGSACTLVANPCGSIGAAIHASGPGDRLKIAAGTYAPFSFTGGAKQGFEVTGGWNPSFTIQARDPSLTVIMASPGEPAVVDSDGPFGTHTIADLTLAGGNLLMIVGAVPDSLDRTLILRNVIVRDSPSRGLRLEVDSAGNRLHVVLVNCLLYGNSSAAQGGALYLNAGEGTELELVAINTTIVGNHAASNGGALFTKTWFDGSSSIEVDLINSIVRGNTAGSGPDLYSSSLNTTISLWHTVFGSLSPGPANYVSAGGNLSTDPLFWLTDGPGDLRLRPDSPAKDAGVCGVNAPVYSRIAPADDFEGDARPGTGALSGCDIGADEAPLFEDRFELGHLGLWSSVVD